MTVQSSEVVQKLAKLSDEEKKLREDLYQKFRKFTLVKVQMMTEAIDCLVDRGYTYEDLKTESKRENIFEEYLLLNQGTEALPQWEHVYKVEAKGEKQPDGSVAISEVQGYWLKTVLDRISIDKDTIVV